MSTIVTADCTRPYVRHRRAPSVLATLLAVAISVAGATDTEFDSGRVGFQVRVHGEVCPYKVLGLFVSPGEVLKATLVNPAQSTDYVMTASTGIVEVAGPGRWHWKAPAQPGLYQIEIKDERTQAAMDLHVFVLVPFGRIREGKLNSYQIGAYPDIPARLLPSYRPPAGFIEVTAENQSTPISPHFKLEQFTCKQQSDFPKYLVLRERLLLKLEAILEIANESGHRCETFAVMSGYRTPYYNEAIGNVPYSRHLWGDAADIYIDAHPVDGEMDDLNGDGRIDYHDADVIYELVDRQYGKPWYQYFVGGLGRYRRSAAHGPFVHIDVRGSHARWGR
jgi:hypothetical protein